jgi:nicotinamidase-related amidase
MRKLLIIIDMQNDFITGTLANKEGQKIVSKIADYIRTFTGYIMTTQDTHTEDYMDTQEGKNLPVPHCIEGTSGWQIVPEIQAALDEVAMYPQTFVKNTFGSTHLGDYIARNADHYEEILMCGVCTDICVISNALLLKAYVPEIKITVLKDLCAGVTPESHENALKAMKACQITIE